MIRRLVNLEKIGEEWKHFSIQPSPLMEVEKIDWTNLIINKED